MRRFRTYALATALVLPFVGLSAVALQAQQPAEQPFWRPVVMGTFGMVAAEHPLEAIAGMEILRAGGNAFDAAAAVEHRNDEGQLDPILGSLTHGAPSK